MTAELALQVVYLLRKPVPSTETLTILAVTMAAELARAGARVHLLVRRLGVPGRRELLSHYGLPDVEGLSVEELRAPLVPRFGRWRGRAFHWVLRRRLRALARRGPTIAYTTGEGALELASVLIRDRSRTGVPVVYESQKIYRSFHLERGLADRDRAERHARRADVLERAVYSGADGLVAISAPLLEDIEALGEVAGRTLVAPLGSHPNPRADREPRTHDLVYAGDLAPWKGMDVLLDAMERLRGGRLTVAGGVREESVRALREDVERRGLAGRVDVLGYLPPSEIPVLLARSRVAPIPLPDDNAQAARHTSPHKLFEALEAGCAVVTSDLPSMRAIVTGGHDALLVPPRDPGALAAALEQVLSDDALRARLAAAGRETARRYHWSERARRTLEFLEEVHTNTVP